MQTDAPTTALASLAQECQILTDTLDELGEGDWETPTPARGWTIRHQVAHLINVYELAQGASTGEAFRPTLQAVAADFQKTVETAMRPLLGLEHQALLARWKETADRTYGAFSAVPAGEVLPWLVNDIPAAVLCMAGTTEALAHGQDVRDALEISRTVSDHIYPVCEFAYHTRTFGYLGRGETPPDLDLRLELAAPSGAHWTIGSPGGADVVSGDAWDLALLVTRRRHPEDLDITASNQTAARWVQVAQAYRGAPGEDRAPGQFTHRNVRSMSYGGM